MPRKYKPTAPAEAWVNNNPELARVYLDLSREQRARAGQALALVWHWLGGNGMAQRDKIYNNAWEPAGLIKEGKSSRFIHKVLLSGQTAFLHDTPLVTARWATLAAYLGVSPGNLAASAWVQNEEQPNRDQLLGWLDTGHPDYHLHAATILFNLHLKEAKVAWLRPLMEHRLPLGAAGYGAAPSIPQAWVEARLKGWSPLEEKKAMASCRVYFAPSHLVLWERDMLRIALEVLKEPLAQAHASLAKLAKGWEAPARLWHGNVKTR